GLDGGQNAAVVPAWHHAKRRQAHDVGAVDVEAKSGRPAGAVVGVRDGHHANVNAKTPRRQEELERNALFLSWRLGALASASLTRSNQTAHEVTRDVTAWALSDCFFFGPVP